MHRDLFEGSARTAGRRVGRTTRPRRPDGPLLDWRRRRRSANRGGRSARRLSVFAHFFRPRRRLLTNRFYWRPCEIVINCGCSSLLLFSGWSGVMEIIKTMPLTPARFWGERRFSCGAFSRKLRAVNVADISPCSTRKRWMVIASVKEF